MNPFKLSKKADATSTLGILILVIISLAIGIYFLLLYAPGLQNLICTIMNRVVYLGRGIVVNLMWTLFWVILAITLLIIWVFGNLCRAFPVGTAVCAAITVGVTIALTALVLSMFSTLPLFECPIAPVNLGIGRFQGAGVSKDVFIKELGTMSTDCYAMFGRGKYNPLTGKTPPNPRNCYILNFKLREPMTPSDMLFAMMNNTQGDTSYYTLMGSAVIFDTDIPNRHDWFDTELKQGRIFVKYGDEGAFHKWGSADCKIAFTYEPPNRLVYKIFMEEFTVGILNCIKNCNEDTTIFNSLSACGISPGECEPTCYSLPQGCRTLECLRRDSTHCTAYCLDQMGPCSAECIVKISSCTITHPSSVTTFMGNVFNCFGLCTFPPHVLSRYISARELFFANRDYVYWCFDEDVTCGADGMLISDPSKDCDLIWGST